MAVVSTVNKLYSKDKALRLLLKKIALWGMEGNLVIKAFHIEGKRNVGPDVLFRGKIADFLERFPQALKSPDEILCGVRPEDFD